MGKAVTYCRNAEPRMRVDLDAERFGRAVHDFPAAVPVQPWQFNSFQIAVARGVRSKQIIERLPNPAENECDVDRLIAKLLHQFGKPLLVALVFQLVEFIYYDYRTRFHASRQRLQRVDRSVDIPDFWHVAGLALNGAFNTRALYAERRARGVRCRRQAAARSQLACHIAK